MSNELLDLFNALDEEKETLKSLCRVYDCMSLAAETNVISDETFFAPNSMLWSAVRAVDRITDKIYECFKKEKAAPESESESGGQAAQCNLPQ